MTPNDDLTFTADALGLVRLGTTSGSNLAARCVLIGDDAARWRIPGPGVLADDWATPLMSRKFDLFRSVDDDGRRILVWRRSGTDDEPKPPTGDLAEFLRQLIVHAPEPAHASNGWHALRDAMTNAPRGAASAYVRDVLACVTSRAPRYVRPRAVVERVPRAAIKAGSIARRRAATRDAVTAWLRDWIADATPGTRVARADLWAAFQDDRSTWDIATGRTAFYALAADLMGTPKRAGHAPASFTVPTLADADTFARAAAERAAVTERAHAATITADATPTTERSARTA